MRISELSIANFRGVQSGLITFGSFAVLIGANNSGKTTIIEALALLLGKERLVRTLTEHDFFGSKPAEGDRIRIIGTVTDFQPNDHQRHLDWFRQGRGVIKWRDSDTGTLKPLSDKPTDKLACQIAFAARFDHETLEVECIRYFYDDVTQDDPFDENANITKVPITLVKELGFFLIPASRTWDKMISFGSELFRRVVAYVGGQPAEAVLAERERLRDPQPPLEADAKLAQLVSKVDTDIKTLLGRPSKLKLRLTTTDSDGVLEAVVPHFAEGDNIPLPSRRQGSGLISLQTLILLMRFGQLRVEKGESFLMAIEEPELHVAPPLQRRLLHLTQSLATQTIITTHSPTVAAVPAPHQLILIVNKEGELQARPLLKTPLAADARSPERSLFLSDRDATVAAVMHPYVLVPEGKTDANWLRLLSRVAELSTDEATEDEPPAFTHEVGVVPTKDARMAEVFGHLAKAHPDVVCLVDGDAAGQGYVAELCGMASPPRIIIRWPEGWRIEDLIGWIFEADQATLLDEELAAVGTPDSAASLIAALLSHWKTNEIVHALLADAIARNTRCRARVQHVLTVLSVIVAGRPVQPDWATAEDHANGTTKLWTFADAVPGI